MSEQTNEIFVRTWPLEGAKATVVITHGAAEHVGRYEYVAQALNAAGYAVSAFDHRGHGRSVGFPGDMGGSIDQVVLDVVAQCEAAKAGSDKVFLLAHSMGTIFALPAAIEAPVGTLSGLILSGTALAPGPAVIESMTSGEGIPASLISRDPDVVKAYEDDPLVFKGEMPSILADQALEAIGEGDRRDRQGDGPRPAPARRRRPDHVDRRREHGLRDSSSVRTRRSRPTTGCTTRC